MDDTEFYNLGKNFSRAWGHHFPGFGSSELRRCGSQDATGIKDGSRVMVVSSFTDDKWSGQ